MHHPGETLLLYSPGDWVGVPTSPFKAGCPRFLPSKLGVPVSCRPVLVAPAMNTVMWNHAAVRRNVQQLRQDGVHFVDPGDGWLSCRAQGAGRMADPETIFAAIEQQLQRL